MNNGIDFGKDGIWKILFKLAPPVMARSEERRVGKEC